MVFRLPFVNLRIELKEVFMTHCGMKHFEFINLPFDVFANRIPRNTIAKSGHLFGIMKIIALMIVLTNVYIAPKLIERLVS